MTRLTPSVRWTLAAAAVAIALIAALVFQLRDDSAPGAGTQARSDREHRAADTSAALSGLRQRANLSSCPAGDGDRTTPAAVLSGVVVECAADGQPVDVGRALAGRRVVLNLWAYWCTPCMAELSALAEYQRRMGPSVLVVTVHQDENEAAALARLSELGVRLPTLQDGRRLVGAALHIPKVMPATVVLRPDGSVAQTLPRDFATADEIAAAVGL